MAEGRQPTYPLEVVKAHVAASAFIISGKALTEAFNLGFDRYDIVACIRSLDESDFYKTMPAGKRPGLMQDVYKTSYLGGRIYLKVQIDGAILTIFQFKEE